MERTEKQRLVQHHGAARVIEVLRPYVSTHRQARIEAVLTNRIKNIQLAIECPSDINNALAAVRSSEALGISKVHIICPQSDVTAARGITQGAIYWVEVIFHDTLAAFLALMRAEGVQLAGGVVTATLPLTEVPVTKPLCIMVGNESCGLSTAAVLACDIQYKIPMYGMTESFNLSVSAAISLFDMTRRKREYLGANSDLSVSEQEVLRAQFYLNSTAPRLSQALLQQKAVSK